MSRQGNKYEQTVAFVLHAFCGDEYIEEVCLQEDFQLPISKKIYKATLKNVDKFIEEYLQLNTSITSIRLDRISHIKIITRD